MSDIPPKLTPSSTRYAERFMEFFEKRGLTNDQIIFEAARAQRMGLGAVDLFNRLKGMCR